MSIVPFRKTYKFSADDVALLDELRDRLSSPDVRATEIAVLRAAFRALKAQLDARTPVKTAQKKNHKNLD